MRPSFHGPRKALIIAVLLLFALPAATSILTIAPPTRGASTGSGPYLDSVAPPPPVFQYNATSFTWGRGSDLVTLNIPTLTVAVASTVCAIAQSGSFSKVNSSAWEWTLSGASACNGVSLSTTMDVYVVNTTNPDQKEIIVKGQTVKAGGSSVVNSVPFPLSITANGATLTLTGTATGSGTASITQTTTGVTTYCATALTVTATGGTFTG